MTSLFEHERVETTVMKAKEARRLAERMITLGKRGTLHARRQAASVLMKKSVVKKLFDEIALNTRREREDIQGSSVWDIEREMGPLWHS